MNATYRTIIEPDAKGFHGYVPALRGCHTWGKTIAATQKNLQEAVEVFLESLTARGKSVPLDHHAKKVRLSPQAAGILR